MLNPNKSFVNKGSIVEAFIGQELLSLMSPLRKQKLYYWRRDERGSMAEVDYLIQKDDIVLPIEVKAGEGTTLKSMHSFLESHPNSPYGYRFSTQAYGAFQKIYSFPLYAVARALKFVIK